MELLNIDNYEWGKDSKGKPITLKEKKIKKQKIENKEKREKKEKTENKEKVKKKRKPRKRKIVRSYKTYIKSNLWIKRKNRYWKKYGKKCRVCGSSNYVTLHHKEYNNNYGDEPDKELIAMCQSCHFRYHDNFPTKKNMQEETSFFVSQMKENVLVQSYCDDLDKRFFKLFGKR